jgi:hypothetical protein
MLLLIEATVAVATRADIQEHLSSGTQPDSICVANQSEAGLTNRYAQ